MIDVVKRINELIVLKNWSLYELSNQTGISTNSIYDWSKQKTMPTLKNIIKICDVLGITLEYFFCGYNFNTTKEEKKFIDKWLMLNSEDQQLIIKLLQTLNIK